jgi:predicted nuclease of predicted toxin-antitoxin system
VKRVLFDENMPRKLRRDLPDFVVRTAQEEGWSAFKNGELLKRASTSFDVIVTIDQRMRYQQNAPQFDIGIVVIEVPDTRITFLRALIAEIRSAIGSVHRGEVLVIRPA